MAFASRMLKRATSLMAAVVCLGQTVFLVVPRSTLAAGVVLYYRAIRFPPLAAGRFRGCSISDAWTEAVPADKNAEISKIAARSRILQKDGDLILVDTSAGRFWIPGRDTLTLAEMIQEQDRDIYGAGGGGVRSGDVVLDCGANAGVYARHALERGAKLVVAIDPSPTAIRCLRRNFSAEIAAGRVIIYPKGVWNKNDVLELTTNNALATAANSVSINRGAHGPAVPLTTIDAIVGELKLDRVDFIKMDIEGAEGPALQGGRDTIGRFKPRMAISLEHRPADLEALTREVHGLWPGLTIEYGPCVHLFDRIQPLVMFVR
jgi:FkbM family methyltransferase